MRIKNPLNVEKEINAYYDEKLSDNPSEKKMKKIQTKIFIKSFFEISLIALVFMGIHVAVLKALGIPVIHKTK